MSSVKHILVTGAGGFIGHHLVNRLKAEGYWVRGADLKYPEHQNTAADEYKVLDLRRWENWQEAECGVDFVFSLPADMGLFVYRAASWAVIARHNILINTRTLKAIKLSVVKKFICSP